MHRLYCHSNVLSTLLFYRPFVTTETAIKLGVTYPVAFIPFPGILIYNLPEQAETLCKARFMKEDKDTEMTNTSPIAGMKVVK